MTENEHQEEQVEAAGHRKRPGISQVEPGPFPPGKIPRPIEAVCVQVNKVYDACSQKRCPEVEFDVANAQEIVECETHDFEVKDCDITQIQDDPPLVRVNLEYKYKVTVTYIDKDGNEQTATERVKHRKSVVLFGTEEMECKVEAVLECLICNIFADEIVCEVGEYIVVKTALDVQLLIPSYGFCPPPPECEELPTVCEEWFEAPAPPLFPPQPWELE